VRAKKKRVRRKKIKTMAVVVDEDDEEGAPDIDAAPVAASAEESSTVAKVDEPSASGTCLAPTAAAERPIIKHNVDVLVTAQATDYAYAQYKLNVGVSVSRCPLVDGSTLIGQMVTAILTRVPYDDLKRRQLTEVAKEKGTYKADKDKHKNTAGGVPCGRIVTRRGLL